MDSLIIRNRRFLRDLFAGPFPGHAIIMEHEGVPADPALGDFTLSTRPVKDWLPSIRQNNELRLRRLEELEHDGVPYVGLNTNTAIFAAAFGCEVHLFEGSNAAARPLVRTAKEADALPLPDHRKAPTLARALDLAHLVRETLGTEVPIGVPDIQSPFDIAALIWNKQDFYLAIHDSPDSVRRLVDKCHQLLKGFLLDFVKLFPECNLCHCPNAWAPPEFGCWLSEDEAGCLSVPMFEEFCLPSLVDLSQTFGGMFVHCCAHADHQYGSFRKIPNLRGMNRVFWGPGPKPAIDAFSGRTVLMMAWITEQTALELLDLSLPNTRWLFNMAAQPLDDARRTYDHLRERCPRQSAGVCSA